MWRRAGRPAPKSSAPAGRTRGLRVGRRTLLGEGGCWDPRQVAGRRTGRRKPAPPSATAMPVASSRCLPSPSSARGGRASRWPRGRPGRRGSVSGRARDGGLIGHRRFREAPAREVLTLDNNFGLFSPAGIGAGDSGSQRGLRARGRGSRARPGKERRV